ncbi:MAG: pentapeptide repeat-containing protein [Ktedonobacteraceae bacterium]|nr:pentapeptide repeat-containing protein [Ktedonobacteraceae bacterium]
MADNVQLTLLKKSVKDWNTWRENHTNIPIDLSYADLSNMYIDHTDLSNANLSHANLRHTYMEYTNLRNANLRDANLSGAKLGGVDLNSANLSRATLDCTQLYSVDFTGVNLTQATREEYPILVQFYVLPKWPGVVLNTGGGNRFFTDATLTSIVQGVTIIERRWNEQKEIRHSARITSSSNLPSADSEIIEIVLLMDDGSSRYSFKPSTSDFDFLRASLNSTENREPLYVIFQKRERPSLVIRVSEGEEAHPPINVILSYLEADLS